MAVVPEMMSEKSMYELAEKIATSYMNGKACDSREFIETFLDVREAAKGIIEEREKAKIAAYHNYMSNLSIEDVMNAAAKDEERPTVSYFK